MATPKNYPIGLTIVDVRPLTTEELAHECWDSSRFMPAYALVLSDGSLIYASRDYEGNGPGALFGQTAEALTFVVAPDKETSNVA